MHNKNSAVVLYDMVTFLGHHTMLLVQDLGAKTIIEFLAGMDYAGKTGAAEMTVKSTGIPAL